MELLSFDHSLKKANAKKHLLLGNGFSIDLFPNIFYYGSLFKKAKFNDFPEIEEVFNKLRTEDFELAAQALESAALILPCFKNTSEDYVQAIRNQMEDYAKKIKDTLVSTIAAQHPDLPSKISDNQYEMCTHFLGHFLKDSSKGTLYTLNYDILLYWTLMYGLTKGKFTFNDGFSADSEEEQRYLTWNNPSHRTNVYYLHGALHLFDGGHELKKYSWKKTKIALIEQIRDAINMNYFPLFVSEGTHEEKLKKILHHAYLAKGLRSLKEIGGSLFIHGMSFSDNDEHILNCIKKNTKLNQIFIGLHGPPDSEGNRLIIDKATILSKDESSNKVCKIYFYDSKTANVWRE